MNNFIKGCLFGMAIGDGYGYPTEFLSIKEIKERWSPNGPDHPEGNPILVTDDTQMALAVAKALMLSIKEQFSIKVLEQQLIHHYIVWLNDPKNNRAPGMTCIRSCERLEKGMIWNKATTLNSKGCGANMRVVPVGLLVSKGFDSTTIGAIAQFQSALTHAHPTALTASEITAITVSKLLKKTPTQNLLNELLKHAEQQKGKYHHTYLEDIWDRPPFRSPEEFISLGWEQVIEALLKVKAALSKKDKNTDPCLLVGAGWIAEEAFATALYCFLLFPENPKKAIQRAVVTSGDSDSIACLTGAFSGAHSGMDNIPADWINKIEYKEELETISLFFES